MQKDRLVPIAFCDKDGWPAMGTFDYINMRINGYEFHNNLMAGKEAWTDKRVKDVFDTWRSILPYCQPGANGRTWQEAAHQPAEEGGGHGRLRLPHPGAQFPKGEQADIDFFPFPEINPRRPGRGRGAHRRLPAAVQETQEQKTGERQGPAEVAGHRQGGGHLPRQ